LPCAKESQLTPTRISQSAPSYADYPMQRLSTRGVAYLQQRLLCPRSSGQVNRRLTLSYESYFSVVPKVTLFRRHFIENCWKIHVSGRTLQVKYDVSKRFDSLMKSCFFFFVLILLVALRDFRQRYVVQKFSSGEIYDIQ